MDTMKMGEFISIIRKEKSMTQRELAELLNVTNKAVSKWETGEGYPEITLIPALAEILGVTIDELFKGEREAKEKSNSEDRNPPPNKGHEEYFFNSAMMKFKNFKLISIGLALLGVIAFFTITLTAYYEIIGFGIEMILLLSSGIMLKIACNHVQSSAAKYGEMYPEGRNHLHGIMYANKSSVTMVWIWSFSIIAALPYILLDDRNFAKSIITLETYLRYLPIFVLIGGGITWGLVQYMKPRLKLKGTVQDGVSKISLVSLGLASDVYLGFLFLIISLLTHSLKAPFSIFPSLFFLAGIAIYLYTTAKFAVKQKKQLGIIVLIAVLSRNLIIAYNLFTGITPNITSVSVNGGDYSLFIGWDGLTDSLWPIFILIIALSLMMKLLENRVKSFEL